MLLAKTLPFLSIIFPLFISLSLINVLTGFELLELAIETSKILNNITMPAMDKAKDSINNLLIYEKKELFCFEQ